MIEPNPFETLRQMAGGYCLSRGLHVVANLAIARFEHPVRGK